MIWYLVSWTLATSASVSHRLGLYLWRHICKFILCQREALLERRRNSGFPGNAVHKLELRSQTLLYQTLHARWNENDIQNFLKTVGFLQKYSDIKTPARVLILKRAVLFIQQSQSFLKKSICGGFDIVAGRHK